MAFDFPDAPNQGDQYTPAGGPKYEWDGAVWRIVAAADAFVPEAPVDGQIYGRQDAAWASVTSGIEEAPEDGGIYGRQDAAWVGAVPEAPNDAYPYVRYQGGWVPGVWAAPEDGQVYGMSNGNWKPVVTVGTTAPTSPEVGDLWVDTN